MINRRKQSGGIRALVAAKLANSGLTTADAKRLLVRPVTADAVAKLPNAPAGRHSSGALLPYFDLKGKPLTVADAETGRAVPMYRVRYLPPVIPNGFATSAGFKPQRYTQPTGVGCPPYLPPLLDWHGFAGDGSREVWITEGELKSACATKFGQPCVGTGGVWNFKGKDRPLHELFYELKLDARPVVLVRDSDWLTNHQVRYASDALARALDSAGAIVRVLTVPPVAECDKTGLDDYLMHGAANPAAALAVLRDNIKPWEPSTFNDTALALTFANLAKGTLFWATDGKQKSNNHWRYWNGMTWEPSAERALEETDRVHGQLAYEAATLNDPEVRKQAVRWAQRSGDERQRYATLRLATAYMDRKVYELDADPYLLNVQNGVLNLKTFKLLPHNPELMQGRISPATYDPKAAAPLFDKFIRRILPNPAVRAFVQRLAGYCLIGGNPERVFVNWWGAGRNGKTQLKELMLYSGGTYAQVCSPDAFLAGRRTGTVRDDLDALRGARLVVAVEPNKVADLDEATVKELVGGDTVSTRGLYGKYQNWKPEFKPVLVSNHKLTVRGTDDGIWDRLIIVPFPVRIPDNEVVPNYFEAVLKPEVDGYLRWAVDGLRLYWRSGLQVPDEIKTVVKDHRIESDVVRNFVDTCCVIDRNAMAKDCATPDQLRTAFTEYCKKQAIPYRGIELNDRMNQLGYEQRRSDQRYWAGVKIRMHTKF